MYGKWVIVGSFKVWIDCTPQTTHEELEMRARNKINNMTEGYYDKLITIK